MKDCNIQQFTDIKSFINRLLRFLRICNIFSFSVLFPFLSQFRVKEAQRAALKTHVHTNTHTPANVTTLKATAKKRNRNINDSCYRPRRGQGF